MWFGEMSVRGNLCSGKSHSENCRRGNISPGNCPFGELPFEKMSIGKMSSGNCPLGKSPSGKCPSGNCPRTIYLFIYLIIYLFMKYWKYSLWSIMKNQKLPFTSIEKIAAEFFFFFSKFTGKHQINNIILIKFHISNSQFY